MKWIIGLLVSQCCLSVARSVHDSASTLPLYLFSIYVMCFSGAVRFLFVVHLVDSGYRFNLLLMGIDSQVSMHSPLSAQSLQEFWSEKWNPAVQMLLWSVFYKPIREQRKLALLATFIGSAGLHVFPVLLMRGDAQLAVSMAFFFPFLKK